MRIDEDIAGGEFWSFLRWLDFAFNCLFLFTLQILLNVGRHDECTDYKIFGSVKGLPSLHFKGFFGFWFGLFDLVFFSVMHSHICYVEEYSCCPLYHVRRVIKVWSLQLPLAEIRPRARYNFSVASFQLEHKQHTSLLDTEQRQTEHSSHPHSSLGRPCSSYWGSVSKLLITTWRAGGRAGREASVCLLLEHWL